jgi:hypothetical protein
MIPPHLCGEGNGFALHEVLRAASIGMLIGVLFGSVLVMLGGVKRMAVRDLGVVGSFFMVPGLCMLRRFFVVLGGMFVMLSSLLVVFVNCVLFHDWLSGCTILKTLLKSTTTIMTQM